MYKKLGFLFNVDRCIGCRACEMACRNENHTSDGIHWRQVRTIGSDSFLSQSCNHCQNPECFRVCTEKAFHKRRDGIVLIDSLLCNGCKLCVNACPYQAPKYNPETNKVTRCNMCYLRQNAGLLPACVEACTTGALELIDLNSFHADNISRSIPSFSDIKLTKPSVRFHQPTAKKRYFQQSKSKNDEVR